MKKFPVPVEVDCHVHTWEGSESLIRAPEAIEIATRKGLRAIFITNHDSVKGFEIALKAGEGKIEVLPGIELRAVYKSYVLHLLGLMVDINEPGFKKALLDMEEYDYFAAKAWVKEANYWLAEEFGITNLEEEILTRMGNEPNPEIRREHLTRILQEKKYLPDPQKNKDIFKKEKRKFLGKGRSHSSVKPFQWPFKKACSLILRAGGLPFLAHPGKDLETGLDWIKNIVKQKNVFILENEIENLKSLGVLGIEVFSHRHAAKTQERFFKIATRHNLLVSGGSDSHGSLSGIEIGGMGIPYSFLEKMKEKKKELFEKK